MNDFKYSVPASTPQEFKEAIVKWLYDQAVNHRAMARSVKTMRYEKEHKDKADTLEYAAKFIYEIVIEPKDKLHPTENKLTNEIM